MNLDSCSGCHLQPEVGGTSPFVNPQVAFANKMNATNTVPSFITANGPVREARFVRNPDGTPDGGVHALFTITGRDDAPGCVLGQPAFEQELANRNVIFRIPTPTYGAGLIEEIPDSAIVANRVANASTKRLFGISGRVNRNGNDGTLTRFGWKAQNKSLLLFSGEAYNVEMGITNELFQTERDETPTCQFTTGPNTVTNTTGATQCVTVDTNTACTGVNFIFIAAYLGSFDPGNICTNWIGDSGSSPDPDQAFSFNVDNGQTFVVVVSELTPDAGCPAYTITVSPQAICGGATPTASPSATVTVSATPTATAIGTVSPTPTATARPSPTPRLAPTPRPRPTPPPRP